MKTFILSLIFTILVVSEAAKSCRRNEDCSDTECCIDRGPFRRSECRPLSKEGERCSVDDKLTDFFKKYLGHCPCEPSLSCEAQDTKEGLFVKIRYNLRCVAEGTTDIQETEPPVVEETKAPVVEETKPPVVEETEPPVVEETKAPAEE